MGHSKKNIVAFSCDKNIFSPVDNYNKKYAYVATLKVAFYSEHIQSQVLICQICIIGDTNKNSFLAIFLCLTKISKTIDKQKFENTSFYHANN